MTPASFKTGSCSGVFASARRICPSRSSKQSSNAVGAVESASLPSRMTVSIVPSVGRMTA